MSFRQKGLDQLVYVVGRLLERIGGVDPVEDNVARTLMSQFKRHLVLTRSLVYFRIRSAKEQQGFVALSNEAIILSRNRRCSVRVMILFNC